MKKSLIVFSVFIIVIVLLLYIKNGLSRQSAYLPITSEKESHNITRSNALDIYWWDITPFLSGTEEAYACNLDTDKCSSVIVEVSNGDIQKMYFGSGGSIDISAPIDHNGEGEGRDENDYTWSFEVDPYSKLYEYAIQKWADKYQYIVK